MSTPSTTAIPRGSRSKNRPYTKSPILPHHKTYSISGPHPTYANIPTIRSSADHNIASPTELAENNIANVIRRTTSRELEASYARFFMLFPNSGQVNITSGQSTESQPHANGVITARDNGISRISRRRVVHHRVKIAFRFPALLSIILVIIEQLKGFDHVPAEFVLFDRD